MHAPDRQRVRRISARHVDDILSQDVLSELRTWPRVERDVAHLGPVRERLVEADELPLLVAARRRYKADTRPGELEYSFLEAR